MNIFCWSQLMIFVLFAYCCDNTKIAEQNIGNISPTSNGYENLKKVALYKAPRKPIFIDTMIWHAFANTMVRTDTTIYGGGDCDGTALKYFFANTQSQVILDRVECYDYGYERNYFISCQDTLLASYHYRDRPVFSEKSGLFSYMIHILAFDFRSKPGASYQTVQMERDSIENVYFIKQLLISDSIYKNESLLLPIFD